MSSQTNANTLNPTCGFQAGVEDRPHAPKVVVVSLASCFGCQLQITNIESHLLDLLGQIDLGYWQLTSDVPLPEAFDVAVIEGAVTTEQAERQVKRVRDIAKYVITVGACAVTGGIPGMAADGFFERPSQVYEKIPAACGSMVKPRPVSNVIDVDFEVRCCPIDPLDFVAVLQRVLYGSNRLPQTKTLCGECKRNETGCFYEDGTLCMGMITSGGCGARCVNLGRPCMGCAGLSADANLDAARMVAAAKGVPVEAFNARLEIFNQTNPALNPYQ